MEKTFDPNRVSLIVSGGFNDMNELRRQRSFQAKEKGYRLDTYVHPSVRRNDGVTIGENCIILDFTSIHAGSRIGDGTFIASNVNIGHDCDIGPYNYVTSGTSIAGGCKTGTGCFFGVNASLAHGITLGDRTFLGAQTMLNHNTKDDEVYVAEPGQLFRLKSQAFLRFRKVLP